MLLGAAAHFVGLHPIVGAFAGGVVAGESGMTHRIRDEMKPLNFLLVPIFFVYIGPKSNYNHDFDHLSIDSDND